MNRSPFATLLALALVLLPVDASALFRAYLASDGNDANPCTLPQPCRLLPAALAAVDSGGEIWMLDSANYNVSQVTVGKSVSILAIPGAVGSVVAAGGSAINITADNLRVTLRNLVIVPLPGAGGTNGIRMTGASFLVVENGVIANLTVGQGIHVQGYGTLRVNNTVFRNIAGAGRGIYLQDGATATVSNSQFYDSAGAIFVQASLFDTFTNATVTHCTIAGGNEGIIVFANTDGSGAGSTVSHTLIENTSFPISTQTNGFGTAQMSIGYSTVARSNYSYYQEGTGSTLHSLGNNQFFLSGGGVGTLTANPPQ